MADFEWKRGKVHDRDNEHEVGGGVTQGPRPQNKHLPRPLRIKDEGVGFRP